MRAPAEARRGVRVAEVIFPLDGTSLVVEMEAALALDRLPATAVTDVVARSHDADALERGLVELAGSMDLTIHVQRRADAAVTMRLSRPARDTAGRARA